MKRHTILCLYTCNTKWLKCDVNIVIFIWSCLGYGIVTIYYMQNLTTALLVVMICHFIFKQKSLGTWVTNISLLCMYLYHVIVTCYNIFFHCNRKSIANKLSKPHSALQVIPTISVVPGHLMHSIILLLGGVFVLLKNK